MSAFATADDLIARYDENVVRDLLSDTGDPVAGSLTANTVAVAALESASGHILTAAHAGNNYTEAELNALTGVSLAWLKDLTCSLAMVRLMRRRPNRFSTEMLRDTEQSADAWLDALRKGQRLFPVGEHPDTSVPTVGGPTAVDYQRMNLITSRTRNFFPNVARRLPIGRG